MREYINLAEEWAFGFKVSWHDDPVEVFKNPGPSEFLKAKNIIGDMPRALISEGGDLYVWNCGEAHHDDVGLASPVPLVADASLMIDFKRAEVWWHKWEYFRENKNDLYDNWIRKVSEKLFNSKGLKKLFPKGFVLMAQDSCNDKSWALTPEWIDKNCK